ncbi:hypothetical protein O181_009660 [Austropuccinia psidii MF-1]|uniref:Uncharacterized protein n=1 Tax=Austropuccinia psidii MF-1 TaxID=1389203 RepID=A0A9Q3GK48_9BASI|nr:hypothetical protein [Austropuccinia psidii MF-1]
MKPKIEGHVFRNNPQLQEDSKPEAPMECKQKSPPQYHNEDNMTYSEKDTLKKLPEATRWQNLSGIGEYDHMELIYYINGLFMDVPKDYSNNCPNSKKKIDSIEKVAEEEIQEEDSESDSMGDAIRENSDDYQDPKEEFLVEYQEETQLEIQDMQLETGLPQDTSNKNLCKHTQDAQTFLVTPNQGMA